MNGKKVLLIDDDANLLKLAGQIFKDAGAQVFTAQNGSEGISKMVTHQPNLIILDVLLPGMSGFDVCQRIRQVSNTPLIMLSALDQEQNILQGLEFGADDYLAKPFNADILLARAKTVLRRGRRTISQNNSFKYDDGYLEIDVNKHRILVDGKRIKTSPIEFRLLVFLARNAGKVLRFEQILAEVWGNEYQGNVDYVHVYVSHLRRKIEKNKKKPRYILSIHGEGYIFEEQGIK